MTTEDTLMADNNTSKSLPINAMGCPLCQGTIVILHDEELGYYKRCQACDYIEYLNRRFLRFNRQSRQWY